MTRPELPSTAGDIADEYPDIWAAYQRLGESCAKAGPIGARERRLIKLALAIGAESEGAVHSHCRRALEEGIPAAELEHVALLTVPSLGWPAAAAAMSWIWDCTRNG